MQQKLREPSIWHVIASWFINIKASLAASRALLQRLIACMNFTLGSEDLDLFYLYIKGSDFYELWQQHKQLKTMKTNET